MSGLTNNAQDMNVTSVETEKFAFSDQSVTQYKPTEPMCVFGEGKC